MHGAEAGRLQRRPASTSTACGPARQDARANVADRASRARCGGEHTYARRPTLIAHVPARGDCASAPSNASTVMCDGLSSGLTVSGFARRALVSQRVEDCRFARPTRLRGACEMGGVMAAHEDSDTVCGHGWLLRLLRLLRPPHRASRSQDANARPPTRVDPVAPGRPRGEAAPTGGGVNRPPRPRSVTLRSRRPASERVQKRTPREDGLPPWPEPRRSVQANADAPHDLAHRGATAARPPPSLGESGEPSRQRTDGAAVSRGRLLWRKRRCAEQRSNEHHGEYGLAVEHHASRLSN